MRPPPGILALLAMSIAIPAQDSPRPRARAAGIVVGTLPAGALDAITDVPGVRVGHATLRDGATVNTGVTVVLPHGGNLFAEKVPCAVFAMNGFGKLAGSTQVDELGELETPITLTNTLSVGTAVEALAAWTLRQPGNEQVRSVNAVVGETNDGRLNDIRGQHVTRAVVDEALAAARPGAFDCGAVGAGAGAGSFSLTGGIGSASRVAGEHTVGVLVQTNFGGRLAIGGVPMHDLRAAGGAQKVDPGKDEQGSCMIVIATDAPVDARNLKRLAARAFAGMARTGASFGNGSGDYAIAFSTVPSLRIRAGNPLVGGTVLANDAMSPLFLAVAEATEAAIVDSLCAARTTTGNGVTVPELPVDLVKARLSR